MNTNTGLGQVAAATESEYTVWTRSLESALEELREQLALLSKRLEPVRLPPLPPKPETDSAPTPNPSSPLTDYLRDKTFKIRAMNKFVGVILNEIQL